MRIKVPKLLIAFGWVAISLLLNTCAHDPHSVSIWGYPSLPAEEYLVHAKAILYANGEKPPLNTSLDDEDTDLAKKLLENYLKSFPNDSEGINLYAVVLKLKGLLKESEAEFQKAIQIQPQNPAYRFNLANLFLDSNRFDEAIIGYRYLIEQKNDVASFHLNLARACESKKDEPCAREHYQIASELDPTDRLAEEKANRFSARNILSKKISDHFDYLLPCLADRSLKTLSIQIHTKDKTDYEILFSLDPESIEPFVKNKCLENAFRKQEFPWLKGYEETIVIKVSSPFDEKLRKVEL